MSPWVRLYLVAAIALVLSLLATRAWSGERVLLLGDSQAFLLREELGQRVRDAGHTFESVPVAGSTIIQWATPHNDRWDIRPQWWRVFRFHPTVVLVMLGSNDAYMGCRIIRNEPPYLARLLERLRKTRARQIVWLGPPRLAGVREGLDCLANMLAGAGVQYYDARRIDGMTFWNDRLHPDQPGQDRWAGWIWKELLDGKVLEP